MSVETLATIAAIVGVGVALLASLFGGFAWVIRRTDSQSEALGSRLEARIDSMGSRLEARIDSVGSRSDARVDSMGSRLDARIDTLGSTLDARIDSVGSMLDTRMSNVERELVEIKIGLAHIEGPRPRFVAVR